jgi:hypothetical protein
MLKYENNRRENNTGLAQEAPWPLRGRQEEQLPPTITTASQIYHEISSSPFRNKNN